MCFIPVSVVTLCTGSFLTKSEMLGCDECNQMHTVACFLMPQTYVCWGNVALQHANPSLRGSCASFPGTHVDWSNKMGVSEPRHMGKQLANESCFS